MEPAIPEKVQKTEYLVHVKTGDQPTAGNMDQKCSVFVSLIGEFPQNYSKICQQIDIATTIQGKLRGQ